jgi:hypothetical protein
MSRHQSHPKRRRHRAIKVRLNGRVVKRGTAGAK